MSRLGVLAFGDSITNGGGELQWGVALQSWALWVARGLGLAYTTYAVDGARAEDVAHDQVPAFLGRSATPDGRYDLGCLYVGVNDVRSSDWDPEAFAADHAFALEALAARCDRVLLVLLPLALGRPPAMGVAAANAVVAAAARRSGALLLDLRGFGARNLVMVDRVHPTALGQVQIAERALHVLAADGMDVRVRPSVLVRRSEGTPRQRLLGDWTYVYRSLKAQARSARAAGPVHRVARAVAARTGSSRT